MAYASDKELRRCLEETIKTVHEVVSRLESVQEQQQNQEAQPAPRRNGLRSRVVTDININTFTLDKDEEELMDELKRKVEYVFDDHLPSLPQNCRKYLLQVLHGYSYNYSERKFTNVFNMGIVQGFLQDLECTLASLDAFQAAWNGKQTAVQEFIEKYPTAKNKHGLFGTTLLYSAARNDRLKLVEYLLSVARCAVNGQNQQHLEKALSFTTITAKDFNAAPTAASTPLHGACYNGHLDVVKYLVEHGADYFIENHAKETALMNSSAQPRIKQFFQDYLIFGYSTDSKTFPNKTILKEIEECEESIVDCVWEYKSFMDSKWYTFSSMESDELQQSLIVNPGQTFKLDIHLKVRSGVYKVSAVQLLRSGKDLDPTKNLAWIRCRGSSLLNFHCYAIWQIMFTEHPDAIDSPPSLKTFDIPTMHDSTFDLQLNAWYTCDAKTNSQLDQTMNYRRKYVNLDIDYVGSDQLICNLQTFTFENEKKTIKGYIRWIPKIISDHPRHKDKIFSIDNFQPMNNLDPTPLTHKRLKKASQAKKKILLQAGEQLDDDLDEDDIMSQNNANEIVDDDDDDNSDIPNKTFAAPNLGTWSLTDMENDDNSTSPKDTIYHDDNDGAGGDQQPSLVLQMDKYFNQTASKFSPQQQILPTQKSNSSADLVAAQTINSELEKEKRELQARLEIEQAKLKEQNESSVKRTAAQEQKLAELKKHLENMKQEQENLKAREAKLQQTSNSIKTIEFADIQIEVVNDFLTPKFELILNHLRKQSPYLDPFFVDKIPKMSFQTKYQSYTVSITGIPAHHDAFKDILQRIWTLLNTTQSAKDFYQRFIGRIMKTITIKTLTQVKPKTQNWRQYVKFFIQFLIEKEVEHLKLFNDYITQKSRELIDQSIQGTITAPWNELKKQTDKFMKDNSFTDELESIKHKALDEFIKENISTQRLKMNTKPTAKSVIVVQSFIDKIKTIFQTDKKYLGHEVQSFNLIPDLLQRLMIYYCCFAIQLPLYESSKELLDKIEKNAVTIIATSTGSGKSTLLPALLVAEGYDKIIVTQPRRLPCQLISTRVNETMTTDSGSSERIAGWAVSGAEKNPNAKTLFLTDGLLKERLLYDENFITNHIRLNKSVVIFIDEVHERSINIDLCLALLARLLTMKPELKSKMKVIISSATLDASVPALFRQIPHIDFAEFAMPQMGTIHQITKIARPKENILDIVQELCKKRRRHEQILCFVNSVADVHQGVRLLSEISDGAIVAYPLVQSQHPMVQQQNIEHGSIFFSTTVAETSLTFPSLKYVIDTGMINIPVYDIELQRTVLKEIRAAESTIKQRLGRLGRTQPGEYYSLYDFKIDEKPFPIPQICQSELTNIEFSLRKSPLKKGLNYLKQFLPNKPSQQSLDITMNQLKDLGIVDAKSNDQLTQHGENLSKLPDFGSLSMSKSVYAGLCHYNCGRDLILLSSILGVLNTTTIFKSIPQAMKSPDGDFMTLLNIMDEILLVKQSVEAQQFNLDIVCKAKGLDEIKHVIKQALRRYTNLEKTFNLSDDYRQKAQIKSGKWEKIARALLYGHPSNVFVSMRELHDRQHRYVRYQTNDDIAVLDLLSTLTRPISTAPVSLVLAKDIRHSSAVRATAVLSFVGEIKSSWIEYDIERKIVLNTDEETHLKTDDRYKKAMSLFSNRINMSMNNQTIVLKGQSGVVLDAELHLHQQMVKETKFSLTNTKTPNTAAYINLERNLESVMKMSYIFNPMKWRWAAQKQVEITINTNTSTKVCEITVKGRDSENKKVKQEFDSFLRWLQECAVIRHPNAGIYPRLIRPPIRKNCLDIEERIARVTDSKRTAISLHNGVKGLKATRETRMEVVAWIAICKFDCKLEGGFVRDWIVGHCTQRPTNLLSNPASWVTYATNNIPYMNKEVVPGDLDCHLPSQSYFDIDRFQDELHKFDIKCEFIREDWRYVLLFDKDVPTGPFTMDLIEPHVALTHDRIDFDVNNLSVEKDYTRELGMRIDIQQKPYSIELENIIDNIKNKRFQILRPVDNHTKDRIDKMVNIRHWTQHGQPFLVAPNPHIKCHAVLVPLPKSSTLYDEVSTQMKKIATITIISIDQVRNPLLEDAYESMKKIISKQCAGSNPNERELFHGTKDDGINGITEDGFDDRYFNATGYFGHGAYFADDPRKSHGYTAADTNDQTRVMYYNKVLLGTPSVITGTDKTLVSAPKGFHSIQGVVNQYTEYIVYRYGQALPYLKIVYKA